MQSNRPLQELLFGDRGTHVFIRAFVAKHHQQLQLAKFFVIGNHKARHFIVA